MEYLKLISALVIATSSIFVFCWFLDVNLSRENPSVRPPLNVIHSVWRGLKTSAKGLVIASSVFSAMIMVAWSFLHLITYLIN